MEVRHLSVRCVTVLDKTHPKFRPENMLFCLRIKQAAKSCEALFWCVTALDTYAAGGPAGHVALTVCVNFQILGTRKKSHTVQRYAGRLGESERNRNPLGTLLDTFFVTKKHQYYLEVNCFAEERPVQRWSQVRAAVCRKTE